jgi:hypothetical protein
MDPSFPHAEYFNDACIVIATVLALAVAIHPVIAADVPGIGASGPVTPYQSLMDDAAANHNAAIQNMQTCSYSAALQNANRITSDGNAIYTTWGQHGQGNILLQDANNIRSAVSALKNGQTVTFYDIVNNRNIRLSPCGSGNPTPGVTASPGGAPDTSFLETGFIAFWVIVAVGLVLIGAAALSHAAKGRRAGRGGTEAAQPKRRMGGPARRPALRRLPMNYRAEPATGPGAGPYSAPPPGAGEGEYGPPPSIPSAEGGHPLEDMGVIGHTPPLHPPVSSLQVTRIGDFIRMDWTPPQFDPAQEQLIGYDVSRSEPVSWSTALEHVSLGQVGPGVNSFTVPFKEGALYYNVRPIYRTREGIIIYGPAF